MFALSKIMSRDMAMKIVIYFAVAFWIIRVFDMLFEQVPWHLFIVHLAMGGILFAAVWRIDEA